MTSLVNSQWRGAMTMVSKSAQTGLCGYNGKIWVPLSLGAEKGLCVPHKQYPQILPKNAGTNNGIAGSALVDSDVTIRETLALAVSGSLLS